MFKGELAYQDLCHSCCICNFGVIFIGMSATWRYSYVLTTFGNGCRTGGSLSTSRRKCHVRAKRTYKSPRENKIVVRNTLVYWGDYRESGRKVGAQKFGIFSILLYEGSGLSIGNDFKPYKQFFGPVLHYACPIWVCATRTHA